MICHLCGCRTRHPDKFANYAAPTSACGPRRQCQVGAGQRDRSAGGRSDPAAKATPQNRMDRQRDRPGCGWPWLMRCRRWARQVRAGYGVGPFCHGVRCRSRADWSLCCDGSFVPSRPRGYARDREGARAFCRCSEKHEGPLPVRLIGRDARAGELPAMPRRDRLVETWTLSWRRDGGMMSHRKPESAARRATDDRIRAPTTWTRPAAQVRRWRDRRERVFVPRTVRARGTTTERRGRRCDLRRANAEHENSTR